MLSSFWSSWLCWMFARIMNLHSVQFSLGSVACRHLDFHECAEKHVASCYSTAHCGSMWPLALWRKLLSLRGSSVRKRTSQNRHVLMNFNFIAWHWRQTVPLYSNRVQHYTLPKPEANSRITIIVGNKCTVTRLWAIIHDKWFEIKFTDWSICCVGGFRTEIDYILCGFRMSCGFSNLLYWCCRMRDC